MKPIKLVKGTPAPSKDDIYIIRVKFNGVYRQLSCMRIGGRWYYGSDPYGWDEIMDELVYHPDEAVKDPTIESLTDRDERIREEARNEQ